MAPRRILVVGSGGREHALAWRLARDPEPAEVFVAPGNDGMGRRFRRVAAAELDVAALVAAARGQCVDLVVIGPEVPLALGLADALAAAAIPVFGPDRAAARLESSKWFAKQILTEAGVATARAERFEAVAPARAALDRFEAPYVLKADGLAAGKGVRVTEDRVAAEAFLSDCLEGGRFGSEGRSVLIEEFLHGEEASVVAVSDGTDFVLLPAARDYKRAHDRDRGGNTGGMGAFAPHSRLDEETERHVGGRVVAPVLAAMSARGIPYRGALYCGLMLGEDGPRVVEFNCRFGDPETEVMMPLVEGRLGDLLASAATGSLDRGAIARRAGAAVAVALVDEGYPDQVRGAGTIEGLDEVETGEDVVVFHAAGTIEPDGSCRVRGGRVAYVTGIGASVGAARDRAYEAVGSLRGTGWRCRRDIAAAAVEHEGSVAPGAARRSR